MSYVIDFMLMMLQLISLYVAVAMFVNVWGLLSGKLKVKSKNQLNVYTILLGISLCVFYGFHVYVVPIITSHI